MAPPAPTRALGPLEGFVVGITADRRAGDQAELLARRGARVVHGPVLHTAAAAPDDALRAATRRVLDSPPDYVIANTGIGVRGWLTAAESWGWDEALTAVLNRSRVLARGPKAAGALHAAGIDVWWRAPQASLAEILTRLRQEPLSGRTVAFQRHGAAAPEVDEAVRAARAELVEVPVYHWTLPASRRAPNALIDRLCRGDVDALTFTSAPAITSLLELARDRGLEDEVRARLRGGVVTAVIGPHCAAAARAAGLVGLVEPPAARLGSMVRALAARLVDQRATLHTPDAHLAVQGRAVVVRTCDGRESTGWLPTRERWILERLLARPGAVVARSDLRSRGGPATDADHVLDVTIARLRRRLGAAGAVVETVPKRGYRLAATPHRAAAPR